METFFVEEYGSYKTPCACLSRFVFISFVILQQILTLYTKNANNSLFLFFFLFVSIFGYLYMILLPPEQASAICKHNCFDNNALIVIVHMRDKPSCHIVDAPPLVPSLEGEREVSPSRGVNL